MTAIIRGKRSSLNLLDDRGKRSRDKRVGKSPLVSGSSEAPSSRFQTNQKLLQEENDRLLKRLQDSKSTYNIEKWESDRLKQINVVNMRCKYDYVISQKELRKLSASQRAVGPMEESARSALKLPARMKGPEHLAQSVQPQKSQRLTKLDNLIKKKTSRYDEDYHINFIHKMRE